MVDKKQQPIYYAYVRLSASDGIAIKEYFEHTYIDPPNKIGMKLLSQNRNSNPLVLKIRTLK